MKAKVSDNGFTYKLTVKILDIKIFNGKIYIHIDINGNRRKWICYADAFNESKLCEP